MNARKSRYGGFTLIELIAVLVILGIVAALGSGFLISTVDSYRDVQERSKLVAKGRAVMEQMSRRLRQAVPNSIRVSASGNCVEFMPLVAGARYLNDLPDEENMAPMVSSITTASFSTSLGTPSHAVVGALAATDIYQLGSPASRVDTAAFGAGPYTAIPLANPHRFNRNSAKKRVFVASDPMRYCLSGNDLLRYSAYGFSTASISDANPGGSSSLMARDVGTPSTAFTLSAGSEDRGAEVLIALTFTEGGNSVGLGKQVLIRNVP